MTNQRIGMPSSHSNGQIPPALYLHTLPRPSPEDALFYFLEHEVTLLKGPGTQSEKR